LLHDAAKQGWKRIVIIGIINSCIRSGVGRRAPSKQHDRMSAESGVPAY